MRRAEDEPLPEEGEPLPEGTEPDDADWAPVLREHRELEASVFTLELLLAKMAAGLGLTLHELDELAEPPEERVPPPVDEFSSRDRNSAKPRGADGS